jgi:hypothetical protein
VESQLLPADLTLFSPFLDDFVFTIPYDYRIDRETYFKTVLAPQRAHHKVICLTNIGTWRGEGIQQEQRRTTMLQEIQPKTANSVAAILEQELDSMISEWKRQVSLAPSLTNILLSDADRTSHLPKSVGRGASPPARKQGCRAAGFYRRSRAWQTHGSRRATLSPC